MSVVFLTFGAHSAKATSPVYPLQVSSNGHYLVDQDGTPTLVVSDMAWTLFWSYTTAQAEEYLDERASQGFNTVVVDVSGFNPYQTNTAGDYPYAFADSCTSGCSYPDDIPDFSSPNSSYFSHVDDIISYGAADGIEFYMGTANLGSADCSGSQQPYKCFLTTTTAEEIGEYLGNRYASYPNIIWEYGGDTPPSETSDYTSIAEAMDEGIRTYDTSHLASYHIGGSASSSSVFLTESWHNFSSIQTFFTDDTDAYELPRADYTASTVKPTIVIEPNREASDWGTPYDVRQATGWAAFSGVFGLAYIADPFYYTDLPTDWDSYFSLPGEQAFMNIANLLRYYSGKWWRLVPDTSGTFVTSQDASYGSDTWAAGALSDDGTLGMVYVPSQESLTIDMSQLSTSVDAYWYDPTTDTWSYIDHYSNSGSQEFTSPSTEHSDGTTDYILILDGTG